MSLSDDMIQVRRDVAELRRDLSQALDTIQFSLLKVSRVANAPFLGLQRQCLDLTSRIATLEAQKVLHDRTPCKKNQNPFP